jgi:predicted ATPase/DNA-binding CsgD family transcriptional regulator
MALPENLPGACPTLVGRAAHLETLDHLLAKSMSGQGQIVLLTGDEGSGKSRLIAELCSLAQARGVQILQTTCEALDCPAPFAQFIALCESARLSDVLDGEGCLAAITAELTNLLTSATTARPDPYDDRLDQSDEPHRAFTVVAEGLRDFAATAPLLVAIDDIQSADETVIAFLRSFVPAIRALPMMLVVSSTVASRPRDVTSFCTLLEERADATVIALPPLTPREVAQLVRTMFDLPQPIRTEFLQALCAITHGNPACLEEVLFALVASGALYLTDGGWERKPITELTLPVDQTEAIRWRFDRLSPSARQALALAAVAGVHCDPGQLCAMLSGGERVWSNAVEESIGMRLLQRDATGVHFRHRIVRQVLLDLIPDDERSAMHLTVAEHIERFPAERLASEQALLVRHYTEAGEWSRVVSAARQAAERALVCGAPQMAVASLSRALDAAERLGALMPDLLNARAHAYQQLGDLEHARIDDESALALARQLDDHGAEWCALSHLGGLWMGRDHLRAGQIFAQAYTAARASHDATALAYTFNRLGTWHLNMDRPLDAQQEHRKALAIFQSANDQHNCGETLALLGMATLVAGDALQAASYYLQSVRLFGELGDRQRLSSSLAMLAVCGPSYLTELLVCAPADEVDSVSTSELAVAIAHDGGWRAREAYALICLAGCLGPRGEYVRAIETGRKALQIAEEIGHTQWKVAALWTLGTAYQTLMALSTARTYYERALGLAREIGALQWQRLAVGSLVTVCMMLGDFAQAERLFESMRGDGVSASIGQFSIECARVDLALSRGEPQLALELADGLLERIPNALHARPIPRLARNRCEALAMLGRHAEAETTLRAARREAAMQGIRGAQWYLGVALARLLHGQRREVEAARAAQSTRALIEALAEHVADPSVAAPFRQRALAMLPPSTSPASRRALKQAFDGLTSREREVAALIAQGKSNRAIAESLVVSERTAETHVGNILNKLGFSSRAQIAAWATAKLEALREE